LHSHRELPDGVVVFVLIHLETATLDAVPALSKGARLVFEHDRDGV
jgi:hypothetical protein